MHTTEYVQADKFSGRILVTFENGEIIREQVARSNEHLATLEGFIEIARQAGFILTLPNSVGE